MSRKKYKGTNRSRNSSLIVSKKQKKKRLCKLREGLEDIPVGVCAFLIVLGVIIGNVMVIGSWYWGKLIRREESVTVSATFDSYTLHYGRYGSVNDLEICFSDRESLYINAECYRVSVQDDLDDLEAGDMLDMLVHPNSDDIWEIKHGEDIILSFEDSTKRVWASNIGFTVLGIFMYSGASLGIASLVVQYVRKRKFEKDREKYGFVEIKKSATQKTPKCKKKK